MFSKCCVDFNPYWTNLLNPSSINPPTKPVIKTAHPTVALVSVPRANPAIGEAKSSKYAKICKNSATSDSLDSSNWGDDEFGGAFFSESGGKDASFSGLGGGGSEIGRFTLARQLGHSTVFPEYNEGYSMLTPQ